MRVSADRLARGARPVLAVGALACAGAAVLFLPRIVPGSEPTRPGVRAVLVDASASAVRTRLGWEREVAGVLRAESRGAEEEGEDHLVVAFGAEVRRSE